MQTKKEQKFLKRLRDLHGEFLFDGPTSVMEGFEYLQSPEYKSKPGAVKSRGRRLLSSHGIKGLLRLGKHFTRIMPSMLRNINRNFKDMEGFLESAESGTTVMQSPETIIASSPNKSIWDDLTEYAWSEYRVIVGFTELPKEYVFEGKGVPFRYALVFAKEMDKDPIEKAPELDAGLEVITVYNSLGIATNEIASWLRSKYGIVCMANHPLGGLVDTVPLAHKAGLGAIGRNGLLITKKFGPRCRISPVFIDRKLFNFTDSNEHSWVSGFCEKCGSCRRACPTEAIFAEPQLDIEYGTAGIEDRYRTYDREKCFTSFSAHMGCAVCISVCPFSKKPDLYDKMKDRYRGSK